MWLLCHSNSSVTQTLIQREGFAVSNVLGRSMQLKRKKKNTKKVREWWSGSWIKSGKKKMMIIK